MNTTEHVLQVLDDTLRLQGRAQAFDSATPLLGALPELDSMAVVALIAALENHFGIVFDDADLDGSAFATVGALASLVDRGLAATPP